MAIVLRSDKGAPLTYSEFDGNFSDLEAPRTTSQIADGAVNAAKFDTGSVTEDKIKNGAITSSKIRAGNVTTGKIGDGQVNGTHLNSSYHVTTGKTWTIDAGATITNNGTSVGLGEENKAWQYKGGTHWAVPHNVHTLSPLSHTVTEAGVYMIYSHVMIGNSWKNEGDTGILGDGYAMRQIIFRAFHGTSLGSRDKRVGYSAAHWAPLNNGATNHSNYVNARLTCITESIAVGRVIFLDVYATNVNGSTKYASGNIYHTLTVVKV